MNRHGSGWWRVLRIPHRVGYWHEPVRWCRRPVAGRSTCGRMAPSSAARSVWWFSRTLQAAVDDGDRIHAVIRGSALNNDGSTKMTYGAQCDRSSRRHRRAHAVAEIDASTVSYVETHGTGTPLGDPIEIEGLRQAFGVSGGQVWSVLSVRSSPTSVTWSQRPAWRV